jgi:hypothetical protein
VLSSECGSTCSDQRGEDNDQFRVHVSPSSISTAG